MRHILTSVVFVVLLFPSLALSEEVTFDDLVEREGLFYKKFTDVPFTGKTTGQEQGTYKNGVLDGPWVWYYDNGQMWEKGDYKNGKMDGPWVFYDENGQNNPYRKRIRNHGYPCKIGNLQGRKGGLLNLTPVTHDRPSPDSLSPAFRPKLPR